MSPESPQKTIRLPKILRPHERHVTRQYEETLLNAATRRYQKEPLRQRIYQEMIRYFNGQHKVMPPPPRCIFCKVPSFHCSDCGSTHKDKTYIRRGGTGPLGIRACEQCVHAILRFTACTKNKANLKVVEGKHLPNFTRFEEDQFNIIPYLHSATETIKLPQALINKEFNTLPPLCKEFKCAHLLNAIGQSMVRIVRMEIIAYKAALLHGRKTETTLTIKGAAYYYKLKQALDKEHWKNTM